jgi:transposase InsO family protein
MPWDDVERDDARQPVRGCQVVKIAGQKAFQYTALDDCTRQRVLRLYRRQNQVSSLEFFAELPKAFHSQSASSKMTTAPNPPAFSLSVQEAGIRHRYIRPRRPQPNGKVERSHRIDSEEFWSQREFPTVTDAAAALPEWERVYNFDRFSMALHGLTPAEKLVTRCPAETAA